MQTTQCTTSAPARDIDTIILEARHLLGTDKPRDPNKPERNVYPRDPNTIVKVLDLKVESGLSRERFSDRVRASSATLWCWEQGQTGGGKPWPELAHIIRQREVAQLTAAMGVPLTPESAAGWSIPAKSPPANVPTPVSGAVEQASKRIEGLRLAPPVVGVATDKIVDDSTPPTTEDLTRSKSERVPVISRRVTLPAPADAVFQPVDFSGLEIAAATTIARRIRGAEVTKARDEAYAAFQAAQDRMPLAEAAADLVVAYRRSHRGLPGFCRGHFDAPTMMRRLEQWTAGRDEQGEQWDRLIGLLQARGIKPSTVGLGKRQAKTARGVLGLFNEEQPTLARPAKGWVASDNTLYATEDEATARSLNCAVREAADALDRAMRTSPLMAPMFLASDAAALPVADLSRALERRAAHHRALKVEK